MKKLIMKNNVFMSLVLVALISLSSCTDLEVEATDSQLDSIFSGIKTNEESASTVTGAYNNLNGMIGDQANLFALTEVTTDELLIPTRGADWGDNGIWRQLHQHTWSPTHQYILNVWNAWNELQLIGSTVLDERSVATDETKGHAAFLRALGMYVVLDNFGQVPFRDTTADPLADPEVLTGQAAVDFIKADLDNAISKLPSSGPGTNNNRATKAAAQYLLAKVLLNKHIYTGGSPDNGDMGQVVSLVDAIASQGYGLESGYFDIFKEDVDNETIWYIPTSVGNRIWNGLHYNNVTPEQSGGWNGFSTLAEFYDSFEGDSQSNYLGDGQEERRGWVPDASSADASNYGIGYGFLINQQYDVNGNPLTDRSGNPLFFSREFTNNANGQPSLVDNSETTGIRVIKYHPVNGAFTEHEIFFRYSDAHLMKAEAIMRSGGNATTLVNELRTLRGATPLGSLTEQEMLAERGRELYMEFWRRNDMIRFGEYTRAWEFKDPASVGDASKNLFPIPASQLILNPNLVQNPGY
ncbi:MAG: RagB/SusD family nutrient uptake outer membrane protein [Flavobacteriaceae bacterium]